MKKVLALLFVVMLLCAYVAIPSAAVESKTAVATIELQGERNIEGDPAPKELGWGGAAVTIGDKNIVLTAVGRMFFTGANISHAFLIVNEDGSLVREAPITVQGYDDSVDGTFEYYYFEKSEYLVLEAGKTYFFCSDFYGPFDRFYDSSTVTTNGDLEFIGKVDLNLADGSWIFTEMPGVDYLPIDFMYYVEGEEEQTPTEKPADPTEKPADPKPTEPGASDPAEPAPFNLGLIIGIVAAVVVVVVVVVIVVSKKKKA